MEPVLKKKLLLPATIILIILLLLGMFYLLYTKRNTSSAAVTSAASTAASYPYTKQTQTTANTTSAQTTAPSQFTTDLYVKRIYELSYYFGINQYDPAKELPVSALVQYSFCHLFQESLLDAEKADKPVYRQAVLASIQEELNKQFLINTQPDLTKSDLYNADKNIFEMWQPDYSKTIYYDASYTELQNKQIQLDITFYTGSDKKTAEKKYQAILQQSGEYYLFVQINKINI